MKEDHRIYRPNFCDCEEKAWKKKCSSLYGIGIPKLCDTGATLDQLSQQANREQVVNQFNDLLPVGFLAQLVERCTAIAEVKGSNPVQAWNFLQAFFSQLQKLRL